AAYWQGSTQDYSDSFTGTSASGLLGNSNTTHVVSTETDASNYTNQESGTPAPDATSNFSSSYSLSASGSGTLLSWRDEVQGFAATTQVTDSLTATQSGFGNSQSDLTEVIPGLQN